ncbi:unnamed protein product [Urochloa humidicola]
MVNTRSGSRVDQLARTRQRNTNPNPDPQQNQQAPEAMAGMEQFLQAQMTLLQNLTNTIANLQAHANNGANNQNQPPRDKHREFMSHRPPTFSQSTDLLQADDWLKTVEKMLNITKCTDREKVLYASGCLEGTAGDWWDAYTTAHAAADTITWQEFRTNFRNHHIPASLMKLKKKEFLSLKQEGMTVIEYRDKFIQLSRYAPEYMADDEKKQELFLEGLIGPLNYQLMIHTFPNFQKLVDKAIALEHKRNELGEKRKFSASVVASSNTRPRFTQPQQGTPFRSRGQSGNFGQNQGQRSAPLLQRPGFQENFQQNRQATPPQTPVKAPVPGSATAPRACFKCGDPGHLANNCPKRAMQTPQGQSNSAPRQNTPQQQNRSGN